MSQPTVLIVDDSAIIRAKVCDQLEKQGYRTEQVDDGDTAVQKAREIRPDVILLDVELPAIDGYGVLRNIKADPQLTNIPVVFLTGRAETGDIVRGLNMGAHDYLRKPFEPNELIARVSAALRVKQLQDELQQRNEELARSVRTDPLTGLYNRRQLDQELRRLYAAATRRTESLGVVVIDVDRFKSINDQHGHLAGDAVLQAVAARLQATVRGEDLVVRLGGDEFLVLVPAATDESLVRLGEKLRAVICDVPVMVEVTGEDGRNVGTRRQAVHVTVSIGAAASVGEGPDAILRRADMAMYSAKERGRNSVVVAPG